MKFSLPEEILLSAPAANVTIETPEDTVSVKNSEMRILTNGSGEIFIHIGNKSWRMSEHNGDLAIVATSFEIRKYGGCNGLLIK